MPKQQKSFRKNPPNRDVYVKKVVTSAVNQAASKAASQAAKAVAGAKKPGGKPKGKGKITPAGQFLRRVGGIAGGFLGNSMAGTAIGAGISRIFGQGDYIVQRNTLTSGGPPSFAAMNSGIRIAHREYVTDVISSQTFNNTQFEINPISSILFPWLSKVAQNFEEYTIKGLVFYFNTTCGSAISSTNNALGTIGMVTVYDASDAPLASKRECEDYAGCVAGVPSTSLLHPVECKLRSNVLEKMYIQTGQINDPEDAKFYSMGVMNLFTQGMQQAGVTIGELWVSYDIEFYNPKIQPLGTFGSVASKQYVVTSSQSASQVAGAADFLMGGNLGAFYTGSTGLFTIPQGTAAGYYLFNLMSSAAGTFTYQVIPSNFSLNATAAVVFQGNSANLIATPNASGNVAFHGVSIVVQKLDTNAATFTVQYAFAVPSGSIGLDIIISKLPGSLFSPPTILNPFALTKKIEGLELLVKQLQTAQVLLVDPSESEVTDSSSEVITTHK